MYNLDYVHTNLLMGMNTTLDARLVDFDTVEKIDKNSTKPNNYEDFIDAKLSLESFIEHGGDLFEDTEKIIQIYKNSFFETVKK